MATESTLTPLGTHAPDFALPDVTTGTTVRRDDVAAGRPLLVVFLCRHCPYVQHVKDELARLGRDYGDRAGIAGISSNDASAYPDDAPASLAEFARESAFTFPVLYDESQDAARAYGAVCTPDSFLFDRDQRLVYHGRLDQTRPRSGASATGADIRQALDAVLSGGAVTGDQHPALGCSIKWR
ncbi:MAG: thioredoxin family protein [Candidatus Dormibacteraeota bacterium]|nr:thioredoxin family protein [Candidatus Dormibacteraeota bacterium]